MAYFGNTVHTGQPTLFAAPTLEALDTLDIRGVELLRVSPPDQPWPASTGPQEVTTEHLMSIVEAESDGSLRDAVLKIGHVDSRFSDGSPALGWVKNLRVSDDGGVLIGDFVNVPAKLAKLIVGSEEKPAPYRSRSVEVLFNVKTPEGVEYPAYLSGVALLGMEEPAVSGLRDVFDLFAASADLSTPNGTLVEFAAINADEIRDAYYARVRSNPALDTPTAGTVPDKTTQEVTELDIEQVRAELGLEADATEDAIFAAMKEFREKAEKVPTLEADLAAAKQSDAPSLPEGVVPITQEALAELQRKADLGERAYTEAMVASRAKILADARAAGKFGGGEEATKREAHFAKLLEKDEEGTRALIDSMPSLVKMSQTSVSTSPEVTDDLDAELAALDSKVYPEDYANKGGN